MIYDLFLEQVRRCPNKVALVCGDERVTYRGLAKLTEYAVPTLHKTVMIGCIRTDIDGVAGLLACARERTCLVPVAYDSPRSTLDELMAKLRALHDVADKLPFLLLSTSGTTGAPKLVSLTQENKVARSAQFAALYDITPDDVLLVGTPLHYSMPQRLVLTALLNGATAVLVPEYSPANWLAAARQCTVVCGIPQQLRHIVGDTGRMRLVLSASAPRLRDGGQLAATLAARAVGYHECYGTSEVAIATSSLATVSGVAGAGYAAPFAEILVSDEREILVKSALLHSGYFGRPDLTATSLTCDGYFKTGDSGWLGAYGGLHVDGRLSERIKVGGVSVWPEQVDAVVRTMPGVEDCAAFGIPDDELGEVVGLAVVGDVTLRDVQRFCVDKLADAQLPRLVGRMDAIPRTGTGKVMRRKLVCEGLT